MFPYAKPAGMSGPNLTFPTATDAHMHFRFHMTHSNKFRVERSKLNLAILHHHFTIIDQ